MGSHPINLGLRFVIELSALAAFGIWGWQHGNEKWHQYAFAMGIPFIAAAIWGIFNVPNDPSRSGAAPIIVPGIVRLAFEFIFFALATWTTSNLGNTRLSWVLGIAVIVHYFLSYDRIFWLLKQ